jgi:8-oxo-dGTP diphosphatase
MSRKPRLTVDAWIRDSRGRLLLVRRGRPPFRGAWALPGGFCEWGETTERCCAREAKEETGLAVSVGRVMGVYSEPGRDPRGHTITVLYRATKTGGKLTGGDDAAEARFFSPEEIRRLRIAFDHGEIIAEHLPLRSRASRRARARARRGKRGGARG